MPELTAIQEDVSTSSTTETVDDVEGHDPRSFLVSWWELLLGCISLLLWFSLFAGGILINTEPFRNALVGTKTIWEAFYQLSIILPFWTLTNVGILACLAAVLGAVGRRTRFTSNDTIAGFSHSRMPYTRGAIIYYTSAIIRGFGVFTLVLGGLLVLATETLASPTQEGYLRLASTISVISFYAGYDPTVFASLLERAQRFFQKQ